MNRRWNADGDAAGAKTNIDNEYLAAIVEYNKQCSTSVVADQTVLGVNAQPNSYGTTAAAVTGGPFSGIPGNSGNPFVTTNSAIVQRGK
jgi:hypothetical protein